MKMRKLSDISNSKQTFMLSFIQAKNVFEFNSNYHLPFIYILPILVCYKIRSFKLLLKTIEKIMD